MTGTRNIESNFSTVTEVKDTAMPSHSDNTLPPPLPLRFPAPAAIEALHLLLLCTVHSRDQDERLGTLLADEVAAAIAYEVRRDLRNKAQLGDDLLVVTVARCYAAVLWSATDWEPSRALGALLGRAYLANESMAGLRVLGLGRQVEAVLDTTVPPASSFPETYPAMRMLLLPVYVVGPADDVESFKDRLYADPELELRASDRTRAALFKHFGLGKGDLDAATYVPDAFLDELIETMNRGTTMALITDALSERSTHRFSFGEAPVFADEGKAYVPFFSFDTYAEAYPEIDEDELAEAYLAWRDDYNELTEALADEDVAVRVIEGLAAMFDEEEEVAWMAKEEAQSVGDFLVEFSTHAQAHEGEPENEVANIVLGVCELDDGDVAFAVLGKEDREGRLLAQDNLYPVTAAGVQRCIDYAQAEADRLGLKLEITESDEIEFCAEHRALIAPVASRRGSDAGGDDSRRSTQKKLIH
jgi:hypothetical protein